MDGVSKFLVLFAGNAAGAVAAIGEVEAGLDRVNGKIEHHNASIGKIVGVMGAAVATGAVVAGAGAVKLASDFQQAMALIRTQANDTTDNMDTLASSILQLSGQVGQSPVDLANAYYHLASAGYTGQQAFDMLTSSAQLAAVGQSDMETTTKAVINTLKSGIPGVKDASDAVSQLNAIVGNGDMRMQDFASAMSSGVLPTANTFGVSLQSLGAAFDFMTDRGVPADETATRLRMTLSLLGAPSEKATKLLMDAGLGADQAKGQVSAMEEAFKKSGVTYTQLSADMKQPDGIVVALRDLKQHMTDAGVSADEQSAVISRAFGGGRSGAAIMMMWNDLGAVQQKFDQLGGSASNFGNAWKTQQQTFHQQWENAKAAVTSAAISIGTLLLPYVTQLAQWLGQNLPAAISVVQGWLKDHQKTIEAIGNFIGSVLNVAFKVLGDMIGFVSDHFDIIGPLLAGIVGGWVAWNVALGITKLMGIVTFVTEFIGGLLAMVSATDAMTVAQWLLNVAMDANPIGAIIVGIAALIAIIVLVVTHFDTVKKVVGAVWGAIVGFFEKAWDVIKTVLGAIGSFFVSVWQHIVDVVKPILAVIVSIFEVAWKVISTIVGVALTIIKDVILVALALIIGIITIAWNVVSTIVKTVWDVIAGIVSTALKVIIAIFGPPFRVIASIVGAVFNAIRSVIVTVLHYVSNFIHTAITAIVAVVKAVLTPIIAVFQTVWNAVSSVVSTVVGAISSTLGAAWDGITKGVQAVSKVIGDVWNGIASALGSVWNGIQSAASTAWNAITSVIKAPINGIIGLINGFIDMIDGIQIHIGFNLPDWAGGAHVGFDWNGLQIPHIPQLAGGGVLERPTHIIAGERGREWVLNEAQMAALRADAAVEGGDTHVTVNNPTSDVDVISAIRREKYLARMGRRFAPPQSWPASMRAGRQSA